MLISCDDLRESVPWLDGMSRLAGLTGLIEVVRDGLGIPHLRGGSLRDVFFGQGFVQARDRLWQMEYDRRRAAGRWAAYAGPEAVEQDILMRRLGLVASAQADVAALNGETRAVLGWSGHPGSPHCADQVDAWAQQRLQPMLYA